MNDKTIVEREQDMSQNEPDYWDNFSEADEAIEELKATMRASVRDDVKKTIENLQQQNADLTAKVSDLDKLTREAEAVKREYENKSKNAERDARREASKATIRELVEIMGGTLYRVKRENVKSAKCDRCNENRHIPYTTPLGKEQTEYCECNETHVEWKVESVIAHSIEKRDGKFMSWWVGERYGKDSESWQREYLRIGEEASIARVRKSWSSVGFQTEEAAQAIADELNGEEKEPADA